MSARERQSARDAYLSSLSTEDELAARRTAERSGIPEDDPTWLLLAEMQRVGAGAAKCASSLEHAMEAAASRIERAAKSAASGLQDEDALIVALSDSTAAKLAENTLIVDAMATAIKHVEERATTAIGKRASAPASSLAFAVALGFGCGCISIGTAYHIGLGNAGDRAYSAGFHAASALCAQRRP